MTADLFLTSWSDSMVEGLQVTGNEAQSVCDSAEWNKQAAAATIQDYTDDK